jgi:hypothetical protein
MAQPLLGDLWMNAGEQQLSSVGMPEVMETHTWKVSYARYEPGKLMG